MNCKYCGKFCTKDSSQSWYCNSCKTEFRRNGTINMDCVINNKKFFFQNRSAIYPKSPGRIFNDSIGREVCVFDILPNINPSNIIEKLKLYLIFS